MKIPFLNRPETRAGYTDLLTQAILQEATGGTTASVSNLGVTEACAGLWGRSFASATVTPAGPATTALTPAILEAIGRRLLVFGEAVFEIMVEDGAVRLVEASSWEVEERASWRYLAHFTTPEGTFSRTLTADRVLHPRIGVTSKRPWEGESPIPTATARLAAVLETKLTQEVGGPVGNVLPLPHKGSVAALQADIDKLAGRTVLVESTSGGMGDKLGAPMTDWVARRIGADPPTSLLKLREDVEASILAACGCPGSLIEKSDGTLSREEMRRYLHSTLSPVGRIVASECAVKLDTPGLAFDFSALFASDLSGRARAFQSMVGGGMSIEKAASLAGLMVSDDDA